MAPVGAASAVIDQSPTSTTWKPGTENNCEGMVIRALQVTKTHNTSFGTMANQPGTVYRTQTEYDYKDASGNPDPYGNLLALKEQGNMATTWDDRSTTFGYAVLNDGTDYIVNKTGWVKKYSGISGIGTTTLLAYSRMYYDNQGQYNYIPTGGNGLLTKSDQVSVVNGVPDLNLFSATTQGYDPRGNLIWVKDPLNNQTSTG